MRSKPYAENGAERLQQIRSSLGLSMGKFSLALGFRTEGGVYITIRNQKVTRQLLLAAEGLLANHLQQPPALPPVRLILTIFPDGTASTAPFQGESAIIAGKQYLMVPTGEIK